MSIKAFFCSVFTTAAAVMASDAAWAQDGADERPDDPLWENCVTVRRIDHTSVVDDRTVLFYMRGDEVYVNRLDRSCPRLERSGRFSYSVSGGRLCHSDMITVFEPFDPIPGFTCGLGEFRRILAEEAEALERGPDAAEDDIEVETIDIPVEDD